jgi:hypothetical protein
MGAFGDMIALRLPSMSVKMPKVPKSIRFGGEDDAFRGELMERAVRVVAEQDDRRFPPRPIRNHRLWEKNKATLTADRSNFDPARRPHGAIGLNRETELLHIKGCGAVLIFNVDGSRVDAFDHDLMSGDTRQKPAMAGPLHGIDPSSHLEFSVRTRASAES